jgi:hypothetical protein
MVIAAEPLPPSVPPSAADWAAAGVAAAPETSVTASAIIASTAIAITVANNDDHPRNGHNVDDCLHDGHDNVIVDDGLTSSCSLLVICPVDHGN